MRIPRVFHQIWLGSRPMPSQFREFGRSWRALHPGWKMKLWTEATLPPLANRWAFRHASTLSGRANIARYEILHRFGGVYLDTDFECRRNLEPLIAGCDAFVGHYRDETLEQGRFALANNAIMGAVPGHPFCRDLVEEVEANLRVLGAETPISATVSGPVFMTAVLQRHPEVTVFPARHFYPYGPQERWRRGEPFAGAYAVHHWTLSGLTGLALDSRRISADRRPCLTVALTSEGRVDGRRLEWVLEGLSEQTVADFEVLLPRSGAFSEPARRFRGRLKVRRISGVRSAGSAGWRGRALREARARRVLFLDAHCIPDPDVVARHAVLADRPVLMFGYRRNYPAGKFFPFREALDLGAMIAHARRSGPRRRFAPSRRGWMAIESSVFSVPTDSARRLGGLSGATGNKGIRAMARMWNREGVRSIPSLYGGNVTKLA